ncbi:MAG: cobalamin biosynthesis protein CbiD [Oscillospiraceae bacterium]|nr:cobalamin biosynthesis protein CbiD [Oscillospiraceae bacterium]
MEERYIYRGTQKLRCGYTTGSCAAAAAKAAAELLLSGTTGAAVTIATPSGDLLRLPVSDPQRSDTSARCAVVKDSGDDPDVTNGISVYAEVSRIPAGIEIFGGAGVGTVTKPGLDQPVGAAAINSVPRRMISQAAAEIAELYEYQGGLRIVISVPGGEALARKTFNPRMGITGGISIIGTTGIVEPMSSAALVETIRAEANLRRAAGYRQLLLTVGNYSSSFLQMNAQAVSERAVTCSNFIGDALDIGVSLGFEGILLIGHIGKLVKLGAGIMNTHSSAADGRMETLIACGALAGVESAVLRELTDCVTVDAALSILFAHGAAQKTLDVLTERIDHYLQARVKGAAQVGAVIFSDKHPVVLETGAAQALIQRISEE